MNKVCECASCREQVIVAAEFVCQMIEKGHCPKSLTAISAAISTISFSLIYDRMLELTGIPDSPMIEGMLVPMVEDHNKGIRTAIHNELEAGDTLQNKAVGDIVRDMINGAVSKNSGTAEPGDKGTEPGPVDEPAPPSTPVGYVFYGTLDELLQHLSKPDANVVKH